jgi:hypothetical protein
MQRDWTKSSLVSTWGVFLIEVLVALAFLLPLHNSAQTLKHTFLLLFCVVTYAFAPVAGFGWLLLAMGLASCGPEHRWLRSTYLTGWFLVLLYDQVAWAELLVEWLEKR